MEPTTNNASGKIVFALCIGLLVGFFLGVFWQDRRDEGGVKDATSQTSSESKSIFTGTKEEVTKTENADTVVSPEVKVTSGISVREQTAGAFAEVTVDAGEVLWVAVREIKDGVPGNILGARRVTPGANQNVVIELLRPTIAGGTYGIAVYRDVGTPDFNHKEDILVDGIEGSFLAQ